MMPTISPLAVMQVKTMVDYHSHILPAVDDGSADLAESIALLDMLRDQGVRCVCATPHYQAATSTPAAFLEKRAQALAALTAALPEGGEYPRILSGAEVAYFPGVSQIDCLSDLRLQGSKLLLLEMPMAPWSEYTLRELTRLACSSEITLLLAHIERYLPFQRAAVWQRLREMGVLMQVNASFFVNRKTRRRALKMLANGEIHALGSDCHGLVTRPPRIGEAVEIIRAKLGARIDPARALNPAAL